RPTNGGRAIHHDGDEEVPFLDEAPHEGNAGSRRGPPVDGPYIVARHVSSDVGEIEALPHKARGVIAGEKRVDPRAGAELPAPHPAEDFLGGDGRGLRAVASPSVRPAPHADSDSHGGGTTRTQGAGTASRM